jgi:hypothetical protein
MKYFILSKEIYSKKKDEHYHTRPDGLINQSEIINIAFIPARKRPG